MSRYGTASAEMCATNAAHGSFTIYLFKIGVRPGLAEAAGIAILLASLRLADAHLCISAKLDGCFDAAELTLEDQPLGERLEQKDGAYHADNSGFWVAEVSRIAPS